MSGIAGLTSFMKSPLDSISENLLKIYPKEDIEKYDLETLEKELEDDFFINSLIQIEKKERPDYCPFRVEFLMNDCADLITKLIQSRGELKDLESLLIKDTFKRLLYTERIENMSENGEYLVNMLGEFQKKVKNKNLDKIINEFEQKLIKFETKAESGLNYLSRYIFLKKLYWKNFEELFSKLKSLEVGLQKVYLIKNSLPLINNTPKDQLLFEYFNWLKNNIEKLNKLLENEQEQIVFIPFQTGISNVNTFSKIDDITNIAWQRLIGFSSKEEDSNKNYGKISFRVTQELFSQKFKDKKFLRIRGIGACVLYLSLPPFNSENHDYNFITQFWNVKVKLPNQVINLNSEDNKTKEYTWEIPELVFTAPNLNSWNSEFFGKSLAYYNLCPWDDKNFWDFEISTQSNLGVDRGSLKNIYLILKLAFI